MNKERDKEGKTAAVRETEETSTSRRFFLRKLWLLIGGIALFEYVLVALTFLRPRKRRRGDEEAEVVVAGPVDGFGFGSVTAFPRGKFYLARLEDGGFLALSRKCTHLGCTVGWDRDNGRFICPCHASSFDAAGNVLSPPAPRALDLYPVRIENGIVKVNVSRTVERQYYETSQAARE